MPWQTANPFLLSPAPTWDGTIPSALTAEEADALTRLGKDQTVLELGAQYGASTLALAQHARIVLSVDWHHGDDHAGHDDSLPVYLRNVRGHPAVVPVVGRFEDVLPLLGEYKFGLAFFDGCHDRYSLGRDIELALPLVHREGWLVFHDYGRYDVAQVLDRYGPQVIHGPGSLAHLAARHARDWRFNLAGS